MTTETATPTRTKLSGYAVHKLAMDWLENDIVRFPNGTTLTAKALKEALVEEGKVHWADLGTGTPADLLEKCFKRGFMTRVGGLSKVKGVKGTRDVVYTFNRPAPKFEKQAVLEEITTPETTPSYYATAEEVAYLRTRIDAIHQMVELLCMKQNVKIPAPVVTPVVIPEPVKVPGLVFPQVPR